MCAAFGAKVIYVDIFEKDSHCAIFVSADELFKRADIISIHASGCDRILTEIELAQCKPGVIIINTATPEDLERVRVMMEEDSLRREYAG